jgi:hypothetical protein
MLDKLFNGKYSSLYKIVIYSRKKVYKLDTGLSAKNFILRNLQIFVISWCVFPWQASPAGLMFVS